MLTKLLREKIHLQKCIIYFIRRKTDSKIIIIYINPILDFHISVIIADENKFYYKRKKSTCKPLFYIHTRHFSTRTAIFVTCSILISHDLLFGPVINFCCIPGKFKPSAKSHMDMLDQALEARSVKSACFFVKYAHNLAMIFDVTIFL